MVAAKPRDGRPVQRLNFHAFDPKPTFGGPIQQAQQVQQRGLATS